MKSYFKSNITILLKYLHYCIDLCFLYNFIFDVIRFAHVSHSEIKIEFQNNF
jgi:hypothetical protein